MSNWLGLREDQQLGAHISRLLMLEVMQIGMDGLCTGDTDLPGREPPVTTGSVSGDRPSLAAADKPER